MNLFGVRLKLHPLFGLIMAASVLTGYFLELLTLFAIVLIHELGHAAMAGHYGWKVTEIRLLPFGGVVLADQTGIVPAREELWVALAGPLQNAWMIGFARLAVHFGVWEAEWGQYFMTANLMIALFNLIPALPLDGGKVMQALLSMWLPYYRSLTLSLWVSLGMSLFVAGFALLEPYGAGIQLNLLIIGVFLLYSNWVALRHLPYQYLRFLMNRPSKVAQLIENGIQAEPIVVSTSQTVSDMLRLLKRDRHHIYYFQGKDGRTEGVFPESSLVARYFRLFRHE